MRNDLCQAILDCGELDLNILDDTEYDFYEIVENIRENGGQVTLASIVHEIFDKGIYEIQSAIENKVEEAKEEIKHWTKDTNEYQELMKVINDLEPLDPWSDIYTYFNYLDTHIGFNYDSGNEQKADIYYRYLGKEIDQIEINMGFGFER